MDNQIVIRSPIGTLDSNMDNDIVYSDSVVYCDNSLYVKGRLDRILLPDGYIQVTYQTIRGRLVAFYKYYYLMKDHQGSARINISEEYLDNRPSEGCREAVSYYPFGKAMTGWTKWVNPFKEPYTYTGKKEETMHGLGWYDYGKRFYDPNYRLSFISIDPLCEKYYSISPYAYCNNNPVNCIDPDGRDWYRHNETGDYYWQEGHDELEDYTNVGASVSIQLGEDSYFNTYQNAGIMANQAVDAFGLISSSGKLQNQFLGKKSPLSEDSKSELFNALVNQRTSEIGLKVGQALLTAEMIVSGGGALGALGRVGINLFAKGAGRVFWSGGEKAMNAAMDYALSNGVTTLEMTRAGKNLTTLTKGMPWSEAGPMWKRLSTVYAKGAKGTIHVFQNSRGVGINSVWGTVEYPILKQNGVNIIYHIVK